MVCASDVVREGIELWCSCDLTYISRCNIGYPRHWSPRCCSSSPNSFLSRTSRYRQPAAQWKGEAVCTGNWRSTCMGESSGAKDSIITSSEVRPEVYHLKLVRAAMESWWRCRWWSRRPGPGQLWCDRLLVSRRRIVESRTYVRSLSWMVNLELSSLL
jgi:hypothetical protein